MRKFIVIICGVMLLVGITACGSDDVTDQIADVLQSDDEHVRMVKGGRPNAYPDKTYGEAFDDFFDSPAWKYFVGTHEGPDEDEDGKPDYTETDVDIVEFTGYCTYQDVKVKALIQFTLSKTDNTFEATYLSFNDVPQNTFMLLALLEKVFLDDSTDEQSEEKMTDTDSDGDRLLEEFIALISSYSEPPDLEEDELEAYFREQFSLWENGEGYYNLMIDDTGHLIMPDHSFEYIGTWRDTYSQRCSMKIQCVDGINYSIDINWGSSAWDNTHWFLYGMYDENKGGIHYYGSRIEEYFPDDGEKQETYVYTDGEGLLWIGKDGMLYWNDYVEQKGEDCVFEQVYD